MLLLSKRSFYCFWLTKCLSPKLHYLKLNKKAVFFQLLSKLAKNISLNKIYSLWFKQACFSHLTKYHCHTTVFNSIFFVTLTLILPELPIWPIPLLGTWLSLKQKSRTIIFKSIAHVKKPAASHSPEQQLQSRNLGTRTAQSHMCEFP